MECPNCGNYLDTSSLQQYVKCNYCQSKIAVMSGVSNIISNVAYSSFPDQDKTNLSSMIDVSKIDIDNGNYQAALDMGKKIIDKYPSVWETYINQAICVFWLGREDLGHLGEVLALLKKAEMLSHNDAAVLAAKKDVAFNLAFIASRKERVGTKVFWALDCFELSQKIISEHSDRDCFFIEYCEKIVPEIRRRLMDGLKVDKKEYDPSSGSLTILDRLVTITKGAHKEALLTYITFARIKAGRCPHDKDLAASLKKMEELSAATYPNVPIPRVKYSFWGNPEIASLSK